MTKNKVNQGIDALRGLDDLDNITKGANLKESRASTKTNNNIKHNKLIQIPDLLMQNLNKAKQDGKIHYSINVFIIDAIREKMLKDGLIKFD